MTDTPFSFRFVRNGQPAGLFARKGCVAERGLQLGDTLVPWSRIVDTTTRDDRLLIVLAGDVPLDDEAARSLIDECALVIAPRKLTAEQLERAIDKRASTAELAATRAHLEAEGRLAEFRCATCPGCEAQVDLTGVAESKLVFCRFCDSVFQARSRKVIATDVCTCSECGYFGRVQGYTEFYFYFLFVMYGFSYKRRFLCDDCAGRLFWKVLAMNSIFLLGVPSAIALKVQSVRGRSIALKSLSTANVLARKGKTVEAVQAYQAVSRQLGEHPGVHLNIARAYLDVGDQRRCLEAVDTSISLCTNYIPALQMRRDLHAALPSTGTPGALSASAG